MDAGWMIARCSAATSFDREPNQPGEKQEPEYRAVAGDQRIKNEVLGVINWQTAAHFAPKESKRPAGVDQGGNRMRNFTAAAVIVFASGTALAQSAPPSSSLAAPAAIPATAIPATEPAAVVPALPANAAVLRVGTEVPLRLSEELTTKGKKLKVGQRFRMEVAEAVFVNGALVIPVGSPAMGEVTDVRNKGMWGKSGKLNARVLYVTVNGRQIRLSGGFDDKGTAGGIGAVATSAILFAPAGFFMTGTSAKIAMGSPVKSFVDEDVVLAMAASAPAPLAVSAPAPDVVPVSATGSPSS